MNIPSIHRLLWFWVHFGHVKVEAARGLRWNKKVDLPSSVLSPSRVLFIVLISFCMKTTPVTKTIKATINKTTTAIINRRPVAGRALLVSTDLALEEDILSCSSLFRSALKKYSGSVHAQSWSFMRHEAVRFVCRYSSLWSLVTRWLVKWQERSTQCWLPCWCDKHPTPPRTINVRPRRSHVRPWSVYHNTCIGLALRAF